MLFRDIILEQLDKKHSAWNEQIRKMAGMDYDTYAKLAIGLLAELKGYIGALRRGAWTVQRRSNGKHRGRLSDQTDSESVI